MLRFKCINAPDAMEHPGLQEFLDNYLIPNHVVSVLDTVILNGRTIVGVLSLESRNEKRTWTTSELAVVQGVCLLIGTVLLLSKKRALEDQNKKLHENYSKLEIALKNVIQLQHTTNRKFEKSLALNLNKKIAPLLTNLQKKLSIGDSDLSMLELYLKDLTSPSLQLEQELKSLTIQELKVIELIKNGKNSTEIAKTLKLSAQTIQTYKKNIRRKLKLQGKKINLQTYLQQFQMPE
jgi:DNA-binding CsgD family transcriptional regulator